jgi:anti-anti-sigma factor
MSSAAIRPAERSEGARAVWMFERRGGVRLVRIAGQLGLSEMRLLDSQIEQVLLPGERVVMDFRAVAHLDYRSLEILNRRAERLAREGGALALCRMSEYVRAILMLGSSPGLMEVHEREEEALASVATGAS